LLAAVAGCGGGGNVSTVYVTRGQLALMPLTRSALGPLGTALKSGVSGVETNAQIVAAGATAPEDRGYNFALARYDG
jgi:hypothetical protein